MVKAWTIVLTKIDKKLPENSGSTAFRASAMVGVSVRRISAPVDTLIRGEAELLPVNKVFLSDWLVEGDDELEDSLGEEGVGDEMAAGASAVVVGTSFSFLSLRLG